MQAIRCPRSPNQKLGGPSGSPGICACVACNREQSVKNCFDLRVQGFDAYDPVFGNRYIADVTTKRGQFLVLFQRCAVEGPARLAAWASSINSQIGYLFGELRVSDLPQVCCEEFAKLRKGITKEYERCRRLRPLRLLHASVFTIFRESALPLRAGTH